MRFREFLENQFTIDSLRAMILKALGGNPNNKDAYDAPLVQFARPHELTQKLYSLNGLENMIDNNAAAIQAIQSSQATGLTVGQLAGILLGSQNAQEGKTYHR